MPDPVDPPPVTGQAFASCAACEIDDRSHSPILIPGVASDSGSFTSGEESQSTSTSSSSSAGGPDPVESESSSNSMSSIPSGDGEGAMTISISGQFGFNLFGPNTLGVGVIFGAYPHSDLSGAARAYGPIAGTAFRTGHIVRFHNNSGVARTVSLLMAVGTGAGFVGTSSGMSTDTTVSGAPSDPSFLDFASATSPPGTFTLVPTGTFLDIPFDIPLRHVYRHSASSTGAIVSPVGGAGGTVILRLRLIMSPGSIVIDNIPVTVTVEDSSTEGPAVFGLPVVGSYAYTPMFIESDPWGP